MIDINELRRLAQEATPGPWRMVPVGDGRQKFAVADSEFLSILTVTDEGGATFGTVYDDADAKFIAAANPAAINELLDRLEAAEKDIALKERVIDSLGLGLNAAAHERDNLRAEVESWKGLAAQFGKEADKAKTHLAFAKDNLNHLRARIERMEKQEPVAWCATDETGTVVEALGMNQSRRFDTALYLAPGAQPAPSAPTGWIRAIDEALVVTHIGVANVCDTYEQAKAKLNNLIGFHVDAATDPAVNGGWKLVPSVPEGFSREDLEAVADGLDGYEKTVNVGNVTGEGDDHLESTTAYAARFIRTMLAAAPEAKPCP